MNMKHTLTVAQMFSKSAWQAVLLRATLTALLLAPLTVLAENRRWLPHHTEDVLKVVTLTDGKASDLALRANGGIEHEKMIEMAEAAGMRRTLATIAAQSADLIEQIVAQVPEWAAAPRRPDHDWQTLRQRWKVE